MPKYGDDRLQRRRRSQITEWVNLRFDPARRTFLFETPDGIGKDLMNLELPRFYRRMNSRTRLTSSGDALPFSKHCYDLDALFPGADKIAGVAKSEVVKEMQFDRFLETTGMTDLATAIDQRLGLDEAGKQARVDEDIRVSGIAPRAMPPGLLGQGQ